MGASSARWSLPPERLVSILAIATAVYYVAAFAYEVGFFWEIGPVYMSAFPMGDHIAHAATLALISSGGTLLIVAFNYAFSGMGSEVPDELVEVAEAADASPAAASPWRRRGWTAVGLLLLAGYFYYLFQGRGPLGPARALELGVCGMGFLLIYYFNRPQERRNKLHKHLLMAGAAVAALVPSAAGNLAYQAAIESEDRIPIHIGDARIRDGVPVFVGSSRLIVKTDRGLYLLSEDGTLRMRIGP